MLHPVYSDAVPDNLPHPARQYGSALSVLLFVLALVILLVLVLSILPVHGQRIVIGILLLILRVVLILILVLVLHTAFLLYLQIHPFSVTSILYHGVF